MTANNPPPPSGSVLNRQITLKSLGEMLYSSNPFYLVSAALVLGAVSSGLDASGVRTATLIPLAIMLGYTVLVAATLIGLVRWGKVWDDARSLMMIVLILLLVLSAASDSELLDSLPSGLGRALAGFGFSLIVLETVRRQLAIRLTKRFLIPAVLMLAYLFLYPVWIARLTAGLSSAREHYRITEAVARFALSGAFVLLTFLPTVLRDADEETGVPWKKSFFPGCIIWCFAAAVMVRTYLMTLSFVPGRGVGGYTELESSFRFAMIAPVMAAALILLTEYLLRRGTGSERKLLVWSPAVLVIPAVRLLASDPEALGRNLWVAALAAGVLVWQRYRGIRHGEVWLAAACVISAAVWRKQAMIPSMALLAAGTFFMLLHALLNRRSFCAWCIAGIYLPFAAALFMNIQIRPSYQYGMVMLTFWCLLLTGFQVIATVFCKTAEDPYEVKSGVEDTARTLRAFIPVLALISALPGVLGRMDRLLFACTMLPMLTAIFVTLWWKRNFLMTVYLWMYAGALLAGFGWLGIRALESLGELLKLAGEFLRDRLAGFERFLRNNKLLTGALLAFAVAVGVSLHKARRLRK